MPESYYNSDGYGCSVEAVASYIMLTSYPDCIILFIIKAHLIMQHSTLMMCSRYRTLLGRPVMMYLDFDLSDVIHMMNYLLGPLHTLWSHWWCGHTDNLLYCHLKVMCVLNPSITAVICYPLPAAVIVILFISET